MAIRLATLDHNGWTLLSAEARHARHPTTFDLPSRQDRETLGQGDAAKLMFEIELRAQGRLLASGVDRMWVMMERREDSLYVGRLLNDPGWAEGLDLKPGVEVAFGPEHVIEIERGAAAHMRGSDPIDG